MSTVKLQILLKPAWRSPEGVERAEAIASALNLRPTARGAATVSAEVESPAFEALFGSAPPSEPPAQPPGRNFTAFPDPPRRDLPVPEPLRDLVQSITVAPPHIRMNE